MVAGEKYYFIVHAYHHFVAEVAEITGKRECNLKNVRRIHSSSRSWQDFLDKGILSASEYTVFPDETNISGWMVEIPWKHPIPG